MLSSTLKIPLHDVILNIQKYNRYQMERGGGPRWRPTGSRIGDVPRLAFSRLSHTAVGMFRRPRAVLLGSAVSVPNHHGTRVRRLMSGYRTVARHYCNNSQPGARFTKNLKILSALFTKGRHNNKMKKNRKYIK